jgi:hypothetical protein
MPIPQGIARAMSLTQLENVLPHQEAVDQALEVYNQRNPEVEVTIKTNHLKKWNQEMLLTLN